jgi:hypothetical protein
VTLPAETTVSAWIASTRRRAVVQRGLLERARLLGGALVEGPTPGADETFLRFSFEARASARAFLAALDRREASALIDDRARKTGPEVTA